MSDLLCAHGPGVAHAARHASGGDSLFEAGDGFVHLVDVAPQVINPLGEVTPKPTFALREFLAESLLALEECDHNGDDNGHESERQRGQLNPVLRLHAKGKAAISGVPLQWGRGFAEETGGAL